MARFLTATKDPNQPGTDIPAAATAEAIHIKIDDALDISDNI